MGFMKLQEGQEVRALAWLRPESIYLYIVYTRITSHCLMSIYKVPAKCSSKKINNF